MNFEEYLKEKREHLNDQKAGPEMWERIETTLEKQSITKPTWKIKTMMLVGALVITLGLIFYIFYSLRQHNKVLEETKMELFAMRAMMADQLQNASSFKRIKAVNISASYIKSDPEITRVLIKTMLNDKSETVRMASINALETYVEITIVKEALIQALDISTSPFIQVKIINILANSNDQNILPILDQIIGDQGSKGYVKEEALAARNTIKSL